jgi:hypothetical protein
MLTENVDFQLIPSDESQNEQSWNIRVLKGDFVETVIVFGNIGYNGEDDLITFNFDVVSSPIDELTAFDEDLQSLAGDILASVMQTAVEEKSLVAVDKETGEQIEY